MLVASKPPMFLALEVAVWTRHCWLGACPALLISRGVEEERGNCGGAGWKPGGKTRHTVTPKRKRKKESIHSVLHTQSPNRPPLPRTLLRRVKPPLTGSGSSAPASSGCCWGSSFGGLLTSLQPSGCHWKHRNRRGTGVTAGSHCSFLTRPCVEALSHLQPDGPQSGIWLCRDNTSRRVYLQFKIKVVRQQENTAEINCLGPNSVYNHTRKSFCFCD